MLLKHKRPTRRAYSKPRSGVICKQTSRVTDYKRGSVVRMHRLCHHSRWQNPWMRSLHHKSAAKYVTKLQVQLGPLPYSCSFFNTEKKFLIQKITKFVRCRLFLFLFLIHSPFCGEWKSCSQAAFACSFSSFETPVASSINTRTGFWIRPERRFADASPGSAQRAHAVSVYRTAGWKPGWLALDENPRGQITRAAGARRDTVRSHCRRFTWENIMGLSTKHTIQCICWVYSWILLLFITK